MTRFLPAFPTALLSLLLARGSRRARAVPDGRPHQRLAAQALAAMSDHELKDLGIGRSQIPGLTQAGRLRDYIGL